MLATVVPLTLVLLAAELPDANTGASANVVAAPATDDTTAASAVAGLRQRPSAVPPKRGIHELKDPGSWPAEPPRGSSRAVATTRCSRARWHMAR